MRHAGEVGAVTIGISSNPDAELSRYVDHPIELVTGPEVIAGSTRLKAGTAQKVVLNIISTIAMVRLGKTFGNLMVDVRATNAKLRDRARRIVADATGCRRRATAAAALDAAGGDVKVAIVMLLTGADAARGRASSCVDDRTAAVVARPALVAGTMRVIGMISGTSMDGIDVAAADLRFVGDTIELRPLGAASREYPAELRDRSRRRAASGADDAPTEVCRLDTLVGQAFAAAATYAVDELGGGAVDLIVSHGQTIFHWVDDEGRARGTLQIGQPAWIAEATGRPGRRRPAGPRHRRRRARRAARQHARRPAARRVGRDRRRRSTSVASPTSRSSPRRPDRSPSTSARPTP